MSPSPSPDPRPTPMRDPDHIALIEKIVAGAVHGLAHDRDTSDMLAEIHSAVEAALFDVRIDYEIIPPLTPDSAKEPNSK